MEGIQEGMTGRQVSEALMNNFSEVSAEIDGTKTMVAAEEERAKGVEQGLSAAVAQNAGDIKGLKGNSATKAELNAEAERAQSAEELINQQAEQNFKNFSELGVEESAKMDGYEIALTKKTNTAEKTKVKVPVYDMQDPSATPVGLVDEIFVEDMKAEAKKMVDAEAERAEAKEQELSGELATEAERAKAAEGSIMAKALDNAGRITALETASATKAELSAEAERASNAEKNIATLVQQNAGKIKVLEDVSATKAELSAEAERAQGEEEILQNKISVCFGNNNGIYFNVDTIEGTIEVLEDIYWGFSLGKSRDNYIPKGTIITIKPSEYRGAGIDKLGGFVKFAFDTKRGVITTLHYLDLVYADEVIIGTCSSEYGASYTRFNYLHLNNDWRYTIDGVDEEKLMIEKKHTSNKYCFIVPFGKGSIYNGKVNPDNFVLYDCRYHEIYDVTKEIECYFTKKWKIRLSFFDAEKVFISQTGTYDYITTVLPPSNAKFFAVSCEEYDIEGNAVETNIDRFVLGDVVVSNVRTMPFGLDMKVENYTDDVVADIDTETGILTVEKEISIAIGRGAYAIEAGTAFSIKQTEADMLTIQGALSEYLKTSQTKVLFNAITKQIYTRPYTMPLHQHEILIGTITTSYATGYVSGSFKSANLPFKYSINGDSEGESVAGDVCFENTGNIYFDVDTVNGIITIVKDIYWGISLGFSRDNYIPKGTTISIKPNEFRSSKVDTMGGFVKIVFDTKSGAINTLHYLDLVYASEVIIGVASSAYGQTYTKFNYVHFINDWRYTIDGVSIDGDKDDTIFARNAKELEIMRTFGASSWYEEYNYNRGVSNWIPKLSMIHVSDTHASRNHFGNSYDVITQELVAFANKVSTNQGTNFNRGNRVKCVVHSGDIKYSVGSDDMTYYSEAVAKSNIPVYHALGNHDIGCEGTKRVELAISDSEAYAQMIAPFLDKWNLKCVNTNVCVAHPEGKCYYFNDFETEKIRLITLYGFETRFELNEEEPTLLKYRRDTESWSQEQIDWLINCLLNLPEGWGVLINQHYPFGTSTGESEFLSYNKCSRGGTLTIINDIVQAFIDGESLIREYSQPDIITPTLSVNVDFSKKKADTEFIAYMSGHTHRDCIGWIEDYPEQLQLNIGCNNPFYDEGSDVTHEMGGKGQDMFNVYCIDRNNGIINILRIGANISCFAQKRELATIKYRK